MTERADWLEWRRDGIGASDVGALLGLSRHQSPWSLWARKVGLTADTESTERQQLGHDFEPVIAQLFTRQTGLYVAGQQTWCGHRNEPWMRCTVDGFVYEGPTVAHPTGTSLGPTLAEELLRVTDPLGGFEAKTDGRFGWPDGVPPNYQAQCQWSMAVTGLQQWWVAVLFAGWRFEVFEVKRDDADIAFMTERARTFWCDHVLTGVAPPVDGSDATLEALTAVYPTERPGVTVELDGDLVGAWSKAKAFARQWRDTVKECEAAIKASLGDAETGIVDGMPLVSWRSQTRKSYTVDEATYRVLRFHKPKGNT